MTVELVRDDFVEITFLSCSTTMSSFETILLITCSNLSDAATFEVIQPHENEKN